MVLFEILTTLILVGLAVYYYLRSTFNFFRLRKIASSEPELFFGTFKDVTLNKKFVADYLKDEYEKHKSEPMFGVFWGRKPVLVIKDPELIKNVLIKDFSAFTDRGVSIVKSVDVLNQNLFFLEPELWRPLRINLSPVFTSGKLKEMFYLLMECARHFEEHLDRLTEKNPVIDCRDVSSKFTTDVIGVCVFGLNTNSLGDEDSEFRKFGRRSFDTSKWKTLKVKIRENLPWLFELLGRWMRDEERIQFFVNMLAETMAYRKKNHVVKHDVVDLLMEIRDNPNKVGAIDFTDEFLTAQAFAFFVAGFETSASTISSACYELALNQKVQDKLRDEVIRTFESNDGTLTFDSVKSMLYMHKVFYETLRKYPVVSSIQRRSVKEYTFEKMNVTIPKGTRVWIPAYAIQRDPEIYPDPDTFDPERFNEENIKARHPSYFLPFGDGPRNCIGARFANYNTKVGIAMIVKNYKIEVCDQTSIPFVCHPRAPLLVIPKDGITLKFTKLK